MSYNALSTRRINIWLKISFHIHFKLLLIVKSIDIVKICSEGGKGGLNHESRKINEIFHDSRKFFEGFHVSRKISAGCNDRRVQGSTLVEVQLAKPRNLRNLTFSEYQIETNNRSHHHTPQKLNFDFTFHGKIIIKFTSHGKAVDHDSHELNF